MGEITDHPLRYPMANELHARPFPIVNVPCNAAFLAIKRPKDAINRDREADRAHLIALLDRFGASHPPLDATHYYGDLGSHRLKWELHTEFVTYTLFTHGVAQRPFDPVIFDQFPADWLQEAPGVRVSSALIRIIEMPKTQELVQEQLQDCFVAESIAVSYTLDKSAMIAGDFRIDTAGHLRFALFVDPKTGARRVGRIMQRLTEIETYKSMSMIALPLARKLFKQMGEIDVRVSELVGEMAGSSGGEEARLSQLLAVSAELEDLMAKSSFRFGAARAYSAIVSQRISALREERFSGRQTFFEFMMRRYDPAMRTVESCQEQLEQMAARVMRAAQLLRTRVEVARSAQNQDLLESMDKRADLQLRLQRTVEGLSVVAISYYGVNLVSYLGVPLVKALGLGVDKAIFAALVTPVVFFFVWWIVRRIRKAH